MPALRTMAAVIAIVSILAPSLAGAVPVHSRPPFQATKTTKFVRSYRPSRYVSRSSGARHGARRTVPPSGHATWAYRAKGWEGAAVRRQAQINQYAPGVTNELAPENKATATGGPSGGVPGFSGH